MTIALVTLLRDPDGKLLPLAKPHLAAWQSLFAEIVVYTSPDGRGATGEWLAQAGARVIADEQEQGVEKLGRVRRDAIQTVPQATALLMIDFDRLIHWQVHYPNELAQVVADLPTYDLWVLGRTYRAFESHPTVQRETERLTNAAFATATRQSWDITSGARGLSATGVRLIAAQGQTETLGVDAEWPMLALQGGLRVGHITTEGLEFETADIHQDRIAQLGYGGWLDAHINTPDEWAKRLKISYQMAEVMQADRFKELAEQTEGAKGAGDGH